MAYIISWEKMPRPKTISGTKFIKFRVSNKFYSFIQEIARRSGLTVSETCRSALLMFFMSLFLGKARNIEDEFYKKYKDYFEKEEEKIG